MMNETRERFLRTILERVSPERIVEIHFFPPIRQGQLESGVAVVALESAPITVAESLMPALSEEPEALDASVIPDTSAPPEAAEAGVSDSDDAAEPAPADGDDAAASPVMAVASRLEVCTATAETCLRTRTCTACPNTTTDLDI